MAGRIPKSKEVDKALRAVLQRVDASLKALNAQAAVHTRGGRYESAEALMETGRQLQDYRARMASMRDDWVGLKRGTPPATKSQKAVKKSRRKKQEITPLWEYYHPVLRAIERLGGQARKAEITREVFKIVENRLMPGDLEPLPSGRMKRWESRVGWCRKHLVAEGWVFPKSEKGKWKLTSKGRDVARTAEAAARKS